MSFHLSHGASGAIRRFAGWVARGSARHPLLEGVNYWDELKDSPSQMEICFAIFANVLELDENGDPINEKYAERRAAAHLYRRSHAHATGSRSDLHALRLTRPHRREAYSRSGELELNRVRTPRAQDQARQVEGVPWNTGVHSATVDHVEAPRPEPFRLSGVEEYAREILPGTTGFRLRPNRIVGKAKLSQDKAVEIVERIVQALETDPVHGNQPLAEAVRLCLGGRTSEGEVAYAGDGGGA